MPKTSQFKISYAQYNEDIVLSALLSDIEKGFYVDIGANYETVDSVTKYFYDLGWSGINVEPIKSLCEKLNKLRPRDVNLNYGIGSEETKQIFREYINAHGHSTFTGIDDGELSKDAEFKEYDVQIRTLSTILKENKVRHIHFMKIDVEGYEDEVIKGNDWSLYRPEVLCIESNHSAQAWHKIIIDANYRLFIKDGLNNYYVAKESWSRTNGYAERAIRTNHETLAYHQALVLNDARKQIELHDAENLKLKQENRILKEERTRLIESLNSAKRLSLYELPLASRISKSVYGLTLDWVKYRFRK